MDNNKWFVGLSTDNRIFLQVNGQTHELTPTQAHMIGHAFLTITCGDELEEEEEEEDLFSFLKEKPNE